MQINWDSFRTYGQDARGIQFKFEDLCRQLFANENLSGNKQFRYLHANPNNAGLETDPIYDEINQRWIGFQAKFFDSVNVDYEEIKRSARKIVENYTGKVGHVDLVYLFSNKPIVVTAKGYTDTVKILNDANIDICLITNDQILDLVRGKYPYLGLYYFGNHTLDQNWFAAQAKYMFEELGERYNSKFNVKTDYWDELSLFVHDHRGAEYLNAKKARLQEEINHFSLKYEGQSNRAYLVSLSDAVSQLPDVNQESMYQAEKWVAAAELSVEKHIGVLKAEIETFLKQQKENASAIEKSENEKDKQEALTKRKELESRIKELTQLIELPKLLEITERENQLLHGQILTIYGDAGIGKTQLLAAKTQSLISEGRCVLPLVAGLYYDDTPIQDQIIKNLSLNFSFEELINILETLGEKNNSIVPIFIDALNESWNNSIWKKGLPLIIDKIRHTKMVRIVVSYRSEYEKALLPDAMRTGENDIVTIRHRGFEENSTDAIKEFLNHNNIPFSPLDYFGYEMSNPLFLTLYCKTYNGQDVSLPGLYERLIEQANYKLFCTHGKELLEKGYYEDNQLLQPLIKQIADYMIIHDTRTVSKTEIAELGYWNEYRLAPVPFVTFLLKEGILHDSLYGETEKVYFAYDQMNDYYCAKAILAFCKSKEEVRNYLSEKVLGIKDSVLQNSWNTDLFVTACALYAEKYGEECIDIIDGIKDDDDEFDIFSRFLRTYQWRDPNYVKVDVFMELLHKYPCNAADLWPVLIGNAVKTTHPLNADFLHSVLLRYELNKRDYFWTVYINRITWDESDRIVQLIKLYNSGEKIKVKTEKQVELLLTLLGWVLTSSNRWLRDCASKAMIEILKEHFTFCKTILVKFNDVNDPYVFQRLYGVVFGACCKRTNGDLKEIAEYVYETIFNQEKVYPDILLRDYARLIIERFLYETPSYNGIIKRKKIEPPYSSDPIPEIEDQHYENKDHNRTLNRLIMSMRIEGMGGYGDFGRYVFQRALDSFDVDNKKMFNYAVYHIVNDLGFSEELFGEHDWQCGIHERYLTAKTERIGKKYQWITFYNILARIADNNRMIDRWGNHEDTDICFEGAWEPYVRDFDPTLNSNFMKCSEAPIFKQLENHRLKGIQENKAADISSEELRKAWLEKKGIFYRELKDNLVLKDESGTEWVTLTKYCDTGRKNLDIEKLSVWSWLYAYFMTEEQADIFLQQFEKGLSISSYDFGSAHETYTVFHREYPWSPSCKEFETEAWTDAKIKTGEMITETIPDLIFPEIDAILREYATDPDLNNDIFEDELLPDEEDETEGLGENDHLSLQHSEKTRQRAVEREIGKILHATTNLLWEEEYDASKEEPISTSMPCGKLIEVMGLRQLTEDGFFYDKDGRLAAFDTDLTQNINSVVVRKDILDGFLAHTGLKLVWLVDAEKEIHASDRSIETWSDWEAVYVYNDDHIDGDIHMLPHENRR